MSEVPAGLVLLLGTLLLLVAAIGVLRLPDFYLRCSAVSKASSLGAGLVLLGVALASTDAATALRALSGVAFLFLTAPVGSHVLGRAAHRTGVPLFPGTVCDELATQRARRRSSDRVETELH